MPAQAQPGPLILSLEWALGLRNPPMLPHYLECVSEVPSSLLLHVCLFSLVSSAKKGAWCPWSVTDAACRCHDSKDTSVVMRARSLPHGPGDSAEQTWGAEGVGRLKQCLREGLTSHRPSNSKDSLLGSLHRWRGPDLPSAWRPGQSPVPEMGSGNTQTSPWSGEGFSHLRTTD